ncbi:MAG: hypothetical protein CMG46_00450 [Candidatus Marinimicrobia bacterium]|nr:hypothetical protein [Candidatus Neomarinimicrobiota bacterium]
MVVYLIYLAFDPLIEGFEGVRSEGEGEESKYCPYGQYLKGTGPCELGLNSVYNGICCFCPEGKAVREGSQIPLSSRFDSDRVEEGQITECLPIECTSRVDRGNLHDNLDIIEEELDLSNNFNVYAKCKEGYQGTTVCPQNEQCILEYINPIEHFKIDPCKKHGQSYDITGSNSNFQCTKCPIGKYSNGIDECTGISKMYEFNINSYDRINENCVCEGDCTGHENCPVNNGCSWVPTNECRPDIELKVNTCITDGDTINNTIDGPNILDISVDPVSLFNNSDYFRVYTKPGETDCPLDGYYGRISNEGPVATCTETSTVSVQADADACAAVTNLGSAEECEAVMTAADNSVAACTYRKCEMTLKIADINDSSVSLSDSILNNCIISQNICSQKDLDNGKIHQEYPIIRIDKTEPDWPWAPSVGSDIGAPKRLVLPGKIDIKEGSSIKIINKNSSYEVVPGTPFYEPPDNWNETISNKHFKAIEIKHENNETSISLSYNGSSSQSIMLHNKQDEEKVGRQMPFLYTVFMTGENLSDYNDSCNDDMNNCLYLQICEKCQNDNYSNKHTGYKCTPCPENQYSANWRCLFEPTAGAVDFQTCQEVNLSDPTIKTIFEDGECVLEKDTGDRKYYLEKNECVDSLLSDASGEIKWKQSIHKSDRCIIPCGKNKYWKNENTDEYGHGRNNGYCEYCEVNGDQANVIGKERKLGICIGHHGVILPEYNSRESCDRWRRSSAGPQDPWKGYSRINLENECVRCPSGKYTYGERYCNLYNNNEGNPGICNNINGCVWDETNGKCNAICQSCTDSNNCSKSIDQISIHSYQDDYIDSSECSSDQFLNINNQCQCHTYRSILYEESFPLTGDENDNKVYSFFNAGEEPNNPLESGYRKWLHTCTNTSEEANQGEGRCEPGEPEGRPHTNSIDFKIDLIYNDKIIPINLNNVNKDDVSSTDTYTSGSFIENIINKVVTIESDSIDNPGDIIMFGKIIQGDDDIIYKLNNKESGVRRSGWDYEDSGIRDNKLIYQFVKVDSWKRFNSNTGQVEDITGEEVRSPTPHEKLVIYDIDYDNYSSGNCSLIQSRKGLSCFGRTPEERDEWLELPDDDRKYIDNIWSSSDISGYPKTGYMLVGENTNTNEAKCKVSSYVLDDTNGNEKIIPYSHSGQYRPYPKPSDDPEEERFQSWLNKDFNNIESCEINQPGCFKRKKECINNPMDKESRLCSISGICNGLTSKRNCNNTFGCNWNDNIGICEDDFSNQSSQYASPTCLGYTGHSWIYFGTNSDDTYKLYSLASHRGARVPAADMARAIEEYETEITNIGSEFNIDTILNRYNSNHLNQFPPPVAGVDPSNDILCFNASNNLEWKRFEQASQPNITFDFRTKGNVEDECPIKTSISRYRWSVDQVNNSFSITSSDEINDPYLNGLIISLKNGDSNTAQEKINNIIEKCVIVPTGTYRDLSQEELPSIKYCTIPQNLLPTGKSLLSNGYRCYPYNNEGYYLKDEGGFTKCEIPEINYYTDEKDRVRLCENQTDSDGNETCDGYIDNSYIREMQEISPNILVYTSQDNRLSRGWRRQFYNEKGRVNCWNKGDIDKLEEEDTENYIPVCLLSEGVEWGQGILTGRGPQLGTHRMDLGVTEDECNSRGMERLSFNHLVGKKKCKYHNYDSVIYAKPGYYVKGDQSGDDPGDDVPGSLKQYVEQGDTDINPPDKKTRAHPNAGEVVECDDHPNCEENDTGSKCVLYRWDIETSQWSGLFNNILDVSLNDGPYPPQDCCRDENPSCVNSEKCNIYDKKTQTLQPARERDIQISGENPELQQGAIFEGTQKYFKACIRAISGYETDKGIVKTQ